VLCLDFANTLDSRPTDKPSELLEDYEDLMQWSVQSGAITRRIAKSLLSEAARRSRKAAAVLRRARALREAIFELCSASAHRASPPVAALAVLNDFLPAAFEQARLVHNQSEYRWEWQDENALDCMLRPVVRSAAELLTSERLDRVRVCAADNCDWLFLDQVWNEQTGESVREELLSHYFTVTDLFRLIEHAVRQGVDKLDVQYHPTLGHPTATLIDYPADE
jgi:predicted RNA-binding Zn ribbon-like protein